MPKISFRKTPTIPNYYSDQQIDVSKWYSSTWQLQNSLKKKEHFEIFFSLSEAEKNIFTSPKKVFNIRTPPYYASLAKDTGEDAIRKILMPSPKELSSDYQEMLDPLGEKVNQTTEGEPHHKGDVLLLEQDTKHDGQ